MFKEKLNYIIGENIYDKIDKLTNSSKEILNSSTNLITQLSSLFESMDDEIILEILSDAGKINDFISSISSFTKNELQEIKIKSKIAIEKAEKRKGKISKIKEENEKLKEKIKEAEEEKEKLILNIDSISSQLSEIYMENQIREKNFNDEKINKKNEKIMKEKYIKEINDMQKDMDILKEKSKTFESNATKFKRKSIILEEKNKRLCDELGAQTMQFLKKVKEQNDLRNMINSLKLQNNDLFQKVKNSHIQIEKLQKYCKNLEEKIEKDKRLRKNSENNFNNNENNNDSYNNNDINNSNINNSNINNSNNIKSGKKIKQFKEKNISNISDSDNDNKNENDIRYKTFSNLNDLLVDESDNSCKKEINKKFDRKSSKKLKNNNFKRYSFDLDYIFEINLNTYENFFG